MLAIRLRRALFGIARREALFARRGFAAAAAERRARLELIGSTFIDGYNAWLSRALDTALPGITPDLQGFAVEGAAMASALLDHLVDPLVPWRPGRRARWRALLQGRPEHRYMIHVGAGWAIARLRGSLPRAVAASDPLIGWLVADGWGFHQTYFHPGRWATGRKRVPARHGYLGHAVDQGVGRALWFVAGAEPARVAAHVERFAPDRRADLWSGVGLAATYAGGCPPAELTELVRLAGGMHPQLAQGAAFAATCRALAGNTIAPTDAAARVITGRSASELDQLANALRPTAPYHDHSYETWRGRLAEALAARKAA